MAVGVPKGVDLLVLGRLDDALDRIEEHLAAGTADAPAEADGCVVGFPGFPGPAPRSVCVIASGDPGFFGIVRALRERGLDPRVHPVASSVAGAFAAVGLTWDDAVVVSCHGRDLRRVVNVCRAFPKVAVLTGPGAGAAEIAAELCAGPEADRTFVVAQRLGELDERVQVLSSMAAVHAAFDDPHVLLCLDESRLASSRGWLAGWNGVPGPWALDESAFAHRDSMITKSEIRAVAVARLAPRPGTLVWDVGAGSGSVAIECARFGAAAVAIESDHESCERIRANAARHGVSVDVRELRFPDEGTEAGVLPAPDAIFVGGGGIGAIAACAETAAPVVVVALAAIERVPETINLLTKSGREVDGVLLQSSRLARLTGDTHRFAAANPVFLLWGERL
jgi:precorrin-6Y C5,15-methyltransferase (decarboxylating)